MILLTALYLAVGQPSVDCSKVRLFVKTYGQSEAVRLARKWGYPERTIEAGKKCLVAHG